MPFLSDDSPTSVSSDDERGRACPTLPAKAEPYASGEEASFILLVDDSEDDVLLTRRALSKANVDCPMLDLDDGLAALELLRARAGAGLPPPRLIMLDVDLPGRNGLQILQQLRRDPNTAQLPVIVLTGCGRSEFRFDIADAAHTAFVRKAVTAQTFRLAVADLGVRGVLRNEDCARV